MGEPTPPTYLFFLVFYEIVITTLTYSSLNP